MKWNALLTTAVLVAESFLIAAVTPRSGHAAIKKVSYPEVKVEIAAPHQPEAPFWSFWKAFGDAVASRNAAALFALVGPTFVWTSRGAMTDEFDPGRDAAHNFKVVFGFRAPGKDQDGGVENGPYWEELAQFASDSSFFSASKSNSMICGPLLAEATNAATLAQAQKKVEIGDDSGTWYFVTSDTPVAKTPGDTGALVGRLNKVAFPILSVHHTTKEGMPAASAPSHYEVLLPSGKTGWIAANAVWPLASNRLCYAKTPDGRWTIVNFDQDQDDQ